VGIAKELGAEVIQNKFVNYSKQFKFGVAYSKPSTKWILRIDADEWMTAESSKELAYLCDKHNDNDDITGIILRFANTFMGKQIKHGGVYPWKKLSVYKTDFGDIEDREMDEHIILSSGKTVSCKKDSIHMCFKGLDYFTTKSNWYSKREMIDFYRHTMTNRNNADFKTRLKMKIYYKLPLGFRSWIYFAYRYYIRFGFLDGKIGRIYFFLTCYWYRFLVDAKIYEQKLDPKELESVGELK
jgi:hypothetical protein